MNEQNYEERLNVPIDERTETGANYPVVSSDLPTDRVPVEAALVNETPVGEAIVYEAVTTEATYTAPVDETIVHEPATPETPNTAPVDETIVHEPATPETPDTPLADETVVHEPATPEAPHTPPVADAIPHQTPIAANAGPATLLSREDAEHFRTRWNEIQGTFVDEPRSAVQQADALVSEAVVQITQIFANERGTLESQWKQNNDVSTEDLRMALRRYRDFFNRLLG